MRSGLSCTTVHENPEEGEEEEEEDAAGALSGVWFFVFFCSLLIFTFALLTC